jgi:hypothetical protein
MFYSMGPLFHIYFVTTLKKHSDRKVLTLGQ